MTIDLQFDDIGVSQVLVHLLQALCQRTFLTEFLIVVVEEDRADEVPHDYVINAIFLLVPVQTNQNTVTIQLASYWTNP